MAQYVPIRDYMEEVRSAGIGIDMTALLENPQDAWEKLSAAQRAQLLVRAKVDAPADAPMSVRVKRSKSGSDETAYVAFEPVARAVAGPFQGARNALAGGTELVPTTVAVTSGDKALPRTVFAKPKDAGTERQSVLALLDQAWGDQPYNVDVEGAFCEFEPGPGEKEIERYPVEPAFSLVAIVRDAEHRLHYRVVEPQLAPEERSLTAALTERLRDVLLDDGGEAMDRSHLLASKVFELLRRYRHEIDRRAAYRIGYYFARNYLGFGRLEPLMRDPNIEDISCNGPSLPVYVVHSTYQNLATSLVFDEFELNSFTIKLAQRGGKLLSIAQPLVDATLPGGSRIQASLGREVTSRGSAFTIRKFREDPLTCVDLIRSGTHSPDSMAFLWLTAELRRNLVIMGATASGKTTTLNCLSQFIPPTLKIVTIEDTREITLQHENWLAAVTRDAFSGAESERISMFDLLRAALRQRPEYIIVGEIRGVEGLTLFQAMSTGHTCFSTMHAGSVENAVYRLENAPISVPRVMLTSLDFFIVQGQLEVEGRQVRRMLSLTELGGIDSTTRNLRTSEIFRWEADQDAIVSIASSQILDQARAKRRWSRSQLDEELGARRKVLEGLVAKKQRDYREVAKAVRTFYQEREGTTPTPGRSS